MSQVSNQISLPRYMTYIVSIVKMAVPERIELSTLRRQRSSLPLTYGTELELVLTERFELSTIDYRSIALPSKLCQRIKIKLMEEGRRFELLDVGRHHLFSKQAQ